MSISGNKLVWGPLGWYFLHTCSFQLLKSKKQFNVKSYQKLFLALPYILPCGDCRNHTRKYYTEEGGNPFIICSANAFTRWTVRFHNHINVMLGKQTFTYQQAYNMYMNKAIDHVSLFNFLRCIINEFKRIKPESERFSRFEVFFSILSSIFPCLVCRENLNLLLPEVTTKLIDCWDNFFPKWVAAHLKKDTDNVFTRFGFICQTPNIMRIKNKRLFIENKEEKTLTIARQIPILPTTSYIIEIHADICAGHNISMLLSNKKGKILELCHGQKKSSEVIIPSGVSKYIFTTPSAPDNDVTINVKSLLVILSFSNEKFCISRLVIQKIS